MIRAKRAFSLRKRHAVKMAAAAVEILICLLLLSAVFLCLDISPGCGLLLAWSLGRPRLYGSRNKNFGRGGILTSGVDMGWERLVKIEGFEVPGPPYWLKDSMGDEARTKSLRYLILCCACLK